MCHVARSASRWHSTQISQHFRTMPMSLVFTEMKKKKTQMGLLEEKCRTAETDIWSQGISLVQKQMGWVIIWMVLMVFVADHNLNLMFRVICRPNNFAVTHDHVINICKAKHYDLEALVVWKVSPQNENVLIIYLHCRKYFWKLWIKLNWSMFYKKILFSGFYIKMLH